jgi:hypothetical protein
MGLGPVQGWSDGAGLWTRLAGLGVSHGLVWFSQGLDGPVGPLWGWVGLPRGLGAGA